MILENIFENHANEDIDYVTVTRQLHAFVLRAWVIVEGHKGKQLEVEGPKVEGQNLRVCIFFATATKNHRSNFNYKRKRTTFSYKP